MCYGVFLRKIEIKNFIDTFIYYLLFIVVRNNVDKTFISVRRCLHKYLNDI